MPAAAAPASAARRITPAASAGVALLALLLTVASRAGQAHPLIGTDRRAVTGDQRTPAGAAGRSAGLARRAGVRSPR